MIINLTQHQATPEQVAAGVVELSAEDARDVRGWLTFEACPDGFELGWRADCIANRAADALATLEAPETEWQAMIGGAPYFMATLEKSLREVGVSPVYAFSVRESVEEVQADGTVRKINVFRHAGFVDPQK